MKVHFDSHILKKSQNNLQEALSALGPKLDTVVTAAQSVAEAVQQLVGHPVALQLLQAVQALQVGHIRSPVTFSTVCHHRPCLLLLAQCCLLCCLSLMRMQKVLLQCVATPNTHASKSQTE